MAVKKLSSCAKTLAVAESCTGGLLSHLLTNVPGSSKYFVLGVVTYSNALKTKLLKIPKGLILKYGAVSEQVCLKMASGVRKTAGADFGIGITGVAGPSGGSKEKPVGTVFIALDAKNKKICRKFLFKGNRLQIKMKSAKEALRLINQLCLKKKSAHL